MKILLVNMSDARGGAAICARRLLHALNAQPDVEARMLVAQRTTDDPNVIALPRRWWLKKLLDRFVVWVANGFSRKDLWLADGGFFGTDITRRPEFREADVVHLHWVNQGMMGLTDMRKVLESGKPVVWTMHDAWLSHPIYHHYGPQLPKGWLWRRLLVRIDKRKSSMLRDARLRLIPCSSWMAEVARQSKLTAHLPVTVIPNALEVNDVQHVSRPSQSDGVKRILFTAARLDDSVKGFDDLLLALNHLKSMPVRLLLAGRIADESLLEQIPVPYEYLGYQSDMQRIIALADCLVSCSRCETLPTTIVEAQAVGTTPVAYRHSGALDLIEEGTTGYFADYRNPESLAHAIQLALERPLDATAMRQHVVEHYSPDAIALRHLEVYKSF